MMDNCRLSRIGEAVAVAALGWLGGLQGAHADTNQWTLGGPEGTVVTALAIDPAGRLYANSPVGAYRTNDGGRKWIHMLDNPNLNVLAVDPLAPATLYAGAGALSYDRDSSGGLFKSIDGGTTWKHIGAGLYAYQGSPRVLSLTLDPSRPTTLYASVLYGGISKSEDGGESWRALGGGLSYPDHARLLAVDPSAPATLYASAGSDLFRSTDAGESFTGIGSGITVGSYFTALAIDPASPGILYAGTSKDGSANVFKSTDGGTTWVEVNKGLEVKGIPAWGWSVSQLAVDPETPATVYATVSISLAAGTGPTGRLFRSADGGGHWVQVGDDTGPAFAVVAMDPRDSSTLYAGSHGDGVFRSSDGGNSWVAINSGLPRRSLECLVFDPLTPTTQYAFDGATLHRSTNRGATWSRVGPFPGCPVIDTRTTTTIYARGFGIEKTTDGGATWRQLPVFGECTRCFVTAFAMDPAVPTTLYVGAAMRLRNPGMETPSLRESPEPQMHDTVSYLFRSTDGGETWTTIWTASFLNKFDIDTIVVAPRTSTAYASHDFGIERFGFEGPDCGFRDPSWRYYIDAGLAIDSASPGTLYAVVPDGLFKCTGQGDWTPANSGLPSEERDGGRFYCAGVPAIDPETPANLYMSGVGCGLFRSTDGGSRWIPFEPALPHGLTVTWPKLEIDPVDPSVLYARTRGGLYTIKQRPRGPARPEEAGR
jgi:photosystem II stability/assembly factor-like uncharacterized protein